MKPTVISTFAGCGGSSLGYQLAGYKELLAVEFDVNAIETFKLNFPNVPVFPDDITRLSGDVCMKLAKIKQKELDVLDGSPPCQGFSNAGNRKLNDKRNNLFLEYCRLLHEIQPKVFVMENVSDMIQGHMKQVYLKIIKTLRNCGYNAKGKLLNAKYFHVPQSRERVIIIGVRNDLKIDPTHPKPQSKPITFGQICKDLDFDCENDRYLPEIIKKYAKHHDGKWTTNKEIYKKIKGNLASSLSLQWLNYNMICGTLIKSEIAKSGIVHPRRTRYLSITEMKRISSFPDDFKLIGTRKDMVARLGNCVPPNLMKAIAEHIKTEILDKIK